MNSKPPAETSHSQDEGVDTETAAEQQRRARKAELHRGRSSGYW